ncbi:MAG: amidohydrolase family protein [Mogibacterium sp.]|nr:amidohydrolase family protein [Mogibacterium sp.]
MEVIRNARLVSFLTEGYDGETADLLLEDGKISRIVPTGTIPASVPGYDAAGKTVLPGMIDLHMHLYFFTANFDKLAVESLDPNRVILHAAEYAEEMLRQGFTTVRDVGNQFYAGILMREMVKAGHVKGPRIFAAGKCISPSANGNETFPGLYAECNDPASITRICREESAKGVDLLKYMATGAVANARGIPGALITTREELQAVKDAADALYLPVAVHCHGKAGIVLCAEVGVTTIEHASDIDAECTELLLKHGGRTAIVPTLGPIGLMNAGLLGEAVAAKIDPLDQQQEHHPMVEANRAGVLTGWGTDVSLDYFAANPGSEFLLRKLRGYTPEEMLCQATRNSAKILGLEDRLGTIAEGKLADLVIVDGKPDEEINVMTKLPAAVYREGVRYY